MPTATFAIRNAVVATCDKGPSDAGLIPAGAVAADQGRIVWVGPDAALEQSVQLDGAEVIDAAGGLVTPPQGLVTTQR